MQTSCVPNGNWSLLRRTQVLNMKDANSKQRNAFVSLGDSRFITGQFARFESLYAVNSVLTLKTPAAILPRIWPKAGTYFRGRSCARFDSSYAMKRCLVKERGYNENLLKLIAQGLYLEIQPYSSRPQRHLQQPLPIFTFFE